MSAQSSGNKLSPPRRLREEEKLLLVKMARGTSAENLLSSCIDNTLVQDMPGRGMGSIRFCPVGLDRQVSGRIVSQASFRDEDGVIVIVSLLLTPGGDLFGVDFFKNDGSRLRRFPRPEDVTLRSSELSPPRRLRDEEKLLLVKMARGTSAENLVLSRIHDVLVQDMPDGGMGSIHFCPVGPDRHVFGRCVSEVVFRDEDNVPVFVSLFLTPRDELFEVDFFKGDGSRLRRYPKPDELILITRQDKK